MKCDKKKWEDKKIFLSSGAHIMLENIRGLTCTELMYTMYSRLFKARSLFASRWLGDKAVWDGRDEVRRAIASGSAKLACLFSARLTPRWIYIKEIHFFDRVDTLLGQFSNLLRIERLKK